MEDKLSNDILLESLIEIIYVITIQPLSEEQLKNYFGFCGQLFSLENACKKLGCVSFNSLIRKYSERFEKFLETYICENKKLYYLNKNIKNDSKLDDFKNKNVESPNEKITFADTIYFEKHNSDAFFHGRSELIKVVSELQNAASYNFYNPNREGFVTFNQLDSKLKELFDGKNWPALRKEWFPNMGKTENIMYEIVFDELEYSYLTHGRPQPSLRLIPGKTLEELLAQIENIKNGKIEFYQKLNNKFRSANFSKFQSSNRNTKKSNPAAKSFSNSRNHKPAKDKSFSESDSENDDRQENQPHRLALYLRNRNKNSIISEQNTSSPGLSNDAKNDAQKTSSSSAINKNSERQSSQSTDNKEQNFLPEFSKVKNEFICIEDEIGKSIKNGLAEELNISNDMAVQRVNEIPQKTTRDGNSSGPSSNDNNLQNMNFDLPCSFTSRKYQQQQPASIPLPSSNNTFIPIKEYEQYTDEEEKEEEENDNILAQRGETSIPPSDPCSPNNEQLHPQGAESNSNPGLSSSSSNLNNNSGSQQQRPPQARRGFQFALGKSKRYDEMTKEDKVFQVKLRMKVNGTDKTWTNNTLAKPIVGPPPPRTPENVEGSVSPLSGNFSVRPTPGNQPPATSPLPGPSRPTTNTSSQPPPQNNNTNIGERRSQELLPPEPSSVANRRQPPPPSRHQRRGPNTNVQANKEDDKSISRTFDLEPSGTAETRAMNRSYEQQHQQKRPLSSTRQTSSSRPEFHETFQHQQPAPNPLSSNRSGGLHNENNYHLPPPSYQQVSTTTNNYQEPTWNDTPYGDVSNPYVNNHNPNPRLNNISNNDLLPPYYENDGEEPEEEEPEMRDVFHDSYTHQPTHRTPRQQMEPTYENPARPVPLNSVFRAITPPHQPLPPPLQREYDGYYHSDNRDHQQHRRPPQQQPQVYAQSPETRGNGYYHDQRSQPPPSYNNYENNYPLPPISSPRTSQQINEYRQPQQQPIMMTRQRPMSTQPIHPHPISSSSALGYYQQQQHRPGSVVPSSSRIQSSRAENRNGNVIEQFCQKIREFLEDNKGKIEIEILQNLLKRARLPSHPENIRQLNDYNWRKFVDRFLPDLKLYNDENGKRFLLDPNELEGDFE